MFHEIYQIRCASELRDYQHPSPPEPCSPEPPPAPAPPSSLRADRRTQLSPGARIHPADTHSPRPARSAPRCWRTPSCPRSPTWLQLDAGRRGRREVVRWGGGENRRESTAAAAVNAQNDKLERGRERPPGEARRCSDLHHPSLQPSLLRAGCFLPHGSDFSSGLLHLGEKTPPSPTVLSPPSLHITTLWPRQLLCCCIFKPHQSLEITLIFLCCSGLKGKPKSLSA